jgi:glycosyltransferase involved in cell wall biosynthesis
MPARAPRAVAGAVQRLLDDPALRARLVAAGRITAAEHAWPRRIDQLEARYLQLARRGTDALGPPA